MTLTPFEAEIEDALIICIAKGSVENGDVAKAAAEIAKRYIQKAMHDAIVHGWVSRGGGLEAMYVHNWLKENGIVPDINIPTVDPPY